MLIKLTTTQSAIITQHNTDLWNSSQSNRQQIYQRALSLISSNRQCNATQALTQFIKRCIKKFRNVKTVIQRNARLAVALAANGKNRTCLYLLAECCNGTCVA